jgi:hypothetical protein
MELQEHVRVQELAEEIRALASQTAERIVEIGNRLIEARAILKPKGEWLSWLESEFAWSRQTAYNFIRVAEAVEREPRLLRFQSPSVLYLVSGAPDEAVEQLLEFQAGYTEARQLIDAHRWADKTKMMIAALREVDLEKVRAEGDRRVESMVRMTAGRILAELDAAMEIDNEARKLAVEIYHDDGVWLAHVTSTDPMENMRNAGASLRERHGEPANGKVRAKFYDDADRARLVVWCPKPHTIVEFPRTGNAQADAWRVACIEACMEVLGCED